ncbi:ATP-grasp domain-containing protein [Nitrospira lenta]|uniref:carboxylate--amine ligase n=1 Tax=Nitrospira lenta TaxID=1436998 RepID=UPI0011B7D54E|nr:ATP-grasp domain-containing protein [Nitrospira lenta]
MVVGSETLKSLAGVSKYCHRTWQYPSPLGDPFGFVASLIDAVGRLGITAIMPVTDSTTQVLAAKRDQFPAAVLNAVPPLESYELVSDKYRLMKVAQALGVPIPTTVYVPDGDLSSVLDQVTSFPVVVKPGRSLLMTDRGWGKTSVHFVSSAEELIDLYRRVPYLKNPSLIQQRVEGEGQGVFGLFDHGRPCALFAHRRIREKPPAGGVSVLRESIELPKPMTDYAVKLLEHVKWHGVAMVEFKVDKASKIPRLMEINGRFWGSLQLAIDAGLNLPYLLHQILSGSPVAVPNNAYHVGTRSRWLLGDLDHLLLRLTRSNTALHLGSEAPSRWRCLADFSRLFQRNLHYEVESLSDPRPALMEYRAWISQLVEGAR